MADNTTLNPGSGGDIIRTEDKSGVKTPVTLIDVGGTGAEALVAVGGQGMPISDNGGSITVDGTVTANLGAADNALLDAIATSLAGTLDVNVTSGGGGGEVSNNGTFAVQEDGPALVALGDIKTAVETVAGLSKAADSVAGSTDTGVAVLAVRDDSLSTLTPAEGDYVPLRVDSTGALYVTGVGGGGGVVNADLIQVLDSAKAPDGGSLVPVTVGRASIDASSSGESVLVEGVSTKACLVLSLFLMAEGTVEATFLYGSGGSPASGPLPLTAGSGFVLPYNPLGWFGSGVDGQDLVLSLSDSVQVSGCIVYAMVPSDSGPE